MARRALGPYLNRNGIQIPPSHSLARAVELAEGDHTVPAELIPRLRALTAETRLPCGMYLRDLINMCRFDADDSAPTGAGGGWPAPNPHRGRRPRPSSPNPPNRTNYSPPNDSLPGPDPPAPSLQVTSSGSGPPLLHRLGANARGRLRCHPRIASAQ